jgi:NADH dehydrogenase (ubiquinone) Fe-S protein 4
MSALPRSIGSRVLPAALRSSAVRAVAPQYRTYAVQGASKEAERKTDPSDSPAANISESSSIRQENAKEGVRHQPDYSVAIDYRTSYVIYTEA